MDKKTAWQTLRDYAEGRIGHTYAGSCPDHLEGHDSRDPECLVCQALDAVQGCLSQIEEPAQPALNVSPGQLANHSDPEGPESAKAGRYLPARKTPAGKFTQPLYAGAAPAAVAGPAPATFMTEDRALEWAWDKVREEVGTKGWTTGDSCNFYGFFLHGWNYRGQYELQRSTAMAALKQELKTAAPALEAPAAPAQDNELIERVRQAYKLVNAHAFDLPGGDAHKNMWLEQAESLGFVIDQLRLAAAPQAPDEMSDAEAHQRHYRGNSVSYIKQKLDVYRGAIDRAFDVLRSAGHHPDGKTELAELIRAALAAAPQAPAAPSGLPHGWVPCILTHDGQHPEEVAYGPQIMMDRLKKWLGRYFELLAQAAPAAPAVDASGAVPVVLGKKLFQFSSHQDWVNRAQRAWKTAGVRSEDTICLDQKGRVLRKGLEFARADKEGAFPVDVYLALVDDTAAHDAWLAAQAKEGGAA